MGWFSSSTPSAPADKSTPPSSETPVSPPSSSTPTSQTTKPLSRDEVAEQELQSFLRELEADTHASSTKYNRVPRNPPPEPSHSQTQTQTQSQTPPQNESTEPLSTQLLPTTMSCRTAFDTAFYCQSFGGQFNNLYRYGTARDCSETWSDFWFCMKTRTYGETEKGKLIKARWVEKERRKYGNPEDKSRELGKSSEDIWKSRERRLEWGEAFCVEEPKWMGSDDEWRRMEREHREGQKGGI